MGPYHDLFIPRVFVLFGFMLVLCGVVAVWIGSKDIGRIKHEIEQGGSR